MTLAIVRALTLCTLLSPCWALSTVPEYFDELEAGDTTYYQVKVKKVTPKSLLVLHEGGMAQILFKDLDPELQHAFGYDPEVEAAYNQRLRMENAIAKKRAREQGARLSRQRRTETQTTRRGLSPLDANVDRILGRFGTEPKMKPTVDLRPRFRQLDLIAKTQGIRPSCSVFAVVSALEFQNSKVSGKPEKLSEEYLIWATRRILGLPTGMDREIDLRPDEGEVVAQYQDAGFSLIEVLQALRSYGIPTYDRKPNTFGLAMAKIADPDPELIQEAQTRRRVYTIPITGRDSVTRINNIIHVLNEGVPVVVGMGWPHWKTLSNSATLSKQKPLEGSGHAVTFVGYRCANGVKESTRFIFKNSYGIEWGVGGHGFVTHDYLAKYLQGAVFLDVQKPD